MNTIDRIKTLETQITSIESRLSEIRRGASRGGAVSEEDLRFLDTFSDADRFWGWYDHNTDANRTITEAADALTIAIANGISANWWSTVSNAPHATIGVPGMPLIVETKIDSFTGNNETLAALCLMRTDSNATASHVFFGPYTDSVGASGLQCGYAGAGWQLNTGAPYNTLPIYLRIYITSLGRGLYVNVAFSFKYSLDGTTWVDFSSDQIDNTWDTGLYGLRGGLFVKNWGANNAVTAAFDYFKAFRSMGPG